MNSPLQKFEWMLKKNTLKNTMKKTLDVNELFQMLIIQKNFSQKIEL